MTSPVGNSESILRLRGGGKKRVQSKKRRTNNIKPTQHPAVAEVLKKEDVWSEYMKAMSTTFKEVMNEDFNKSYAEMNPFEKMLSM
eukprot:777089-Ditylum_brightwellii.AAC.1